MMADDAAQLGAQLAEANLNEDDVAHLRAEFSDRVLIKSIISRTNGGAGLAGQEVRVGGWVKTCRKADKNVFAFLENALYYHITKSLIRNMDLIKLLRKEFPERKS